MSNYLTQIIDFFKTSSGWISIFLIVIAGLWQYWRFIKEWNFKNYHRLIKALNQSDTPNESIKLYRQVAVVYELRNYPRYFSVSKRILKGWLDSRESEEKFKPLYKEMELSIEFMNKFFLCRWWSNIFKK